MNNYFVILKGNNKKLAIKEIEVLWKIYFNEKINLEKLQNVLYSFSSKNKIQNKNRINFLKRLTYTNYIGIEIINGENIFQIENNFKKLNLDKYSNKTFLVRFKKSKSGLQNREKNSEKDFAKIIWDNLSNPKIDLKNPKIEFNPIIFENSKNIPICEKLFENKKDYEKRMPKLRPIKKPYTLKSDMGRASINLLNLKEGIILDPFCGIGGILLESEEMGFKTIGNDISFNDLKDMKTNFNHYFKNSNFKRILADSSTQFLKENTIDGIVCDIPYGKSSRKLGENLYEDFLKQSKKYLKPNKRIVIIYANFLEFKNLALKHFEEIDEIEEYINKSMTRYILILKNSKL